MDSKSKGLWDLLIKVTIKDISGQVRERIGLLGDEANTETIRKELEWGQAEARRRMIAADQVISEPIPEAAKTKKIFKIMLGDSYKNYLRRYKEMTGEEWSDEGDDNVVSE